MILSWTSSAPASWSRISAASCALAGSFAWRSWRSRSSRLSTVPVRSASLNLDGDSSGNTSERSSSAPSGKSLRETAYTSDTTAVAERLMASHQSRKTQSDLVGTPTTAVATRTNASEPAIGSA